MFLASIAAAESLTTQDKGKIKMKKIILMMTICLSACATIKPPVKKEIENKRTFGGSYDLIWSKIISKVASDGMAIRQTDKESGIITFDHVPDTKFYSAYLDCGNVNNAAVNLRPISLNVIVQKGVSQTVTVNLSGGWVLNSVYNYKLGESICYSTGKFEKELFDHVAQ